MTRRDLIQGDLQERVMRVAWRLERGTVEEIRQTLPPKHRGAYTTVQTILNRLVERGLLGREKEGKAFFYAPAVSEADYVARSLDQTLANASAEARRMALANLVGGIDASEMREINSLAGAISRKRRKS